MSGAVLHRRLRTGDRAGLTCLAATETGHGTRASFLSPVATAGLAALRPERAWRTGGGAVAVIGDAGEAAEPGIMAGRRVLLAQGPASDPARVAEWLDWHRAGWDVSGVAWIFRGTPDAAEAWSRTLTAPDGAAVLVVSADRPLGAEGMPDARDPGLAPGGRGEGGGAADPWTAPLAERAVFDALRWRYLHDAASVARLNATDLLLPGADPFAVAEGGAVVVALDGIEAYPWRLRRGAAAPFGDHVFVRRGEERLLPRWCAVPDGADLAWDAMEVQGRTPRRVGARFVRAIGAAFPGVAVERLTDRARLVEDEEIARAFAGRFAAPVRPATAGLAEPQVDRRDVTVITAMRNEGPFLLDWIAHHRAVGVERFLVYSNDCDDGTDRMLDGLAREGVVAHRANPFRETGGVPQHAAFRAALREDAVTGAGWLLTLDVDEYVNIHAGDGRLPDLFEAVPEATLVSMPWRLFGNSDRHWFEDAPVTQQFLRAAPAFCPSPHQAWGFKTLFRNDGAFRRLGVHRPKGILRGAEDRIRWVGGSGRALPPAMWRSAWRMGTASWGYDLVSLNHYAVRSAESFLVKRDRGRVNHVDRDQGAAYWFRMNQNAVEETSIGRREAATRAERDRLLALPGMAEAHEAAVAWHTRRIEELRAEADYARLYAQITSPRMERLSRMAGRFGTGVYLAGPDCVPDEVAARDPGGDWRFSVPRPAVQA